VSSLGGVDVLVNNVAYRRPVDDFSEITDGRWRRTFAVNVDSFFHVTYAKIVLISHELSSQLVSGD